MLLCPCYDFGIHGSQIDVGVRGSQIGIKWALDVGPRNLIFERTIFNEELTFLQNVFIFPINVVACGVPDKIMPNYYNECHGHSIGTVS